MRFLDLVSFVKEGLTPSDPDDGFEETAFELARSATDESVSVDVLTERDRTRHPVISYLDGDERPEFVLRGGTLLISDATGSLAREHPAGELLVVVTDERVVFVLGGRVSDDLWEVPLGDVTSVYLDDESTRTQLIVEANRDDVEMTFFADLTLESRRDSIRACVEHVADEAGGRR